MLISASKLLLCYFGMMYMAAAANAQPVAGRGPYFPPDAAWRRDVSSAPVDPESAAVIERLSQAGGWGNGKMLIDFSIEVLEADDSTPFRTFQRNSGFFQPDCDFVPMPVPPGGALEHESGYRCTGKGDCHLIVVHRSSGLLYEMLSADIAEDNFSGGCLAVWDMNRSYRQMGRGKDCSSSDAAGLPIAPLLINADEVAAGSIDHAIRFILPPDRVLRAVYVEPATHSTRVTSGPAMAVPYGARLRLRPDYPLESLPNEGARVVARGMQRYGILLADAGGITLTAQSDRFTRTKWNGLLGASDLAAIRVDDFQMIAAGERFAYTGDCSRN